jgi:hypothetical protein
MKMVDINEKDLIDKLFYVGIQLKYSLQRKDELVNAFHHFKDHLFKLEPSKIVIETLHLSMRAVIKLDILRYEDKDVKLIIINYINENMRIKTPKVPHTTELMRDIKCFQG